MALAGSPVNIAKTYFKAQEDPTEEQEFYNSVLGQPHEVKGARIMVEDIEACKGNYAAITPENAYTTSGFLTMGVDVGKVLHYELTEWRQIQSKSLDVNTNAIPRVIRVGTVDHFHEIDALINIHHPMQVVIDKNPERRMAYELAQRFPGIVWQCEYQRGISSKQFRQDEEQSLVAVDRTSWMDLALSRFKTHRIQVPFNISREYCEQIQAPVRVYDRDADGNSVGHYRTSENTDDHYAHTRVYSEVALSLALNQYEHQDIPEAVL